MEDKKKLATEAAAKAAAKAKEADTQKKVAGDLEAIKKEDHKRYDVIIGGEHLLKTQFSSEQEVRVNRNALLIGKTIVDMRTAFFGTYKKLPPNSPDAAKWNDYAGVRLNKSETGISRASTFRYSDAYREAVETFTEPVVAVIARHKRMIGMQVSVDNCLGRFTAIAKRLKKKVDPTKPESIKAFVETVVNAPSETKPRTADEVKAALHETILRVTKSILPKGKNGKRDMDTHTAWNIVQEVMGNVLLAFGHKGKMEIEAATEFPDDKKYVTWEKFTKTAATNPPAMEETEHFGHFFGRHNPKNPQAASYPWEIISDADPKHLKVAGHERNRQDASMAAKKLNDKAEYAKTANAARAAKGAVAGATA